MFGEDIESSRGTDKLAVVVGHPLKGLYRAAGPFDYYSEAIEFAKGLELEHGYTWAIVELLKPSQEHE